MLLRYQLLITAISLYFLLMTLYNLHEMLRLPSGLPLPQALPLVSVLIPARNEEGNIRACLESLLAQDYPNIEIIVLDDNSSDATPGIVQELSAFAPQIRLIQGQPLPPEWHGKTWACHQLSQKARGTWLLFVDADTRHQPNSISSALATADSQGLDLLSLIPNMGLKSFWERIIMSVIPFVFVGCLPHALIAKTPYPLLATAIGPFMLFRADTYRRFGGYEAVRSDIVDDVFISREVKRAGGHIALADGVSTLKVEFYRNFREAWNGLSKSAFAAFDYSLFKTLLALAACAIVFLGPYRFLYQAWGNGLTDLAHFSLPLTQIVLIWIGMWLIDGRFAIPRRYAVLIGLTMFMAILLCLNSIIGSLFRGGVVWKGRTYQFK